MNRNFGDSLSGQHLNLCQSEYSVTQMNSLLTNTRSVLLEGDKQHHHHNIHYHHHHNHDQFPDCHKDFSRKDAMFRHIKQNHNESLNQPTVVDIPSQQQPFERRNVHKTHKKEPQYNLMGLLVF